LNVSSTCCIYYFQHMLQPQTERSMQGSSYPPLSHSPPILLSLLRTQEIHPCFALPTWNLLQFTSLQLQSLFLKFLLDQDKYKSRVLALALCVKYLVSCLDQPTTPSRFCFHIMWSTRGQWTIGWGIAHCK
jgi:hypothetical protein